MIGRSLFLFLLIPGLTVGTSGCRNFRPTSDLEHLLSLVNETPRNQKQRRTQKERESNREEAVEEIPFRLTEIKPIETPIGSGLEKKLETPIASKPAESVTQTTRMNSKTVGLAQQANPLRPSRRKMKKGGESMESLVKKWAQAIRVTPTQADSCDGESHANCDAHCKTNRDSLERPATQEPGPYRASQLPPHVEDAGDPIRLTGHDDEKGNPPTRMEMLQQWVDMEDLDIQETPGLDVEHGDSNANWKERLDSTLLVLTEELQLQQKDQPRSLAKLRLLQLLSGNIVMASEPISCLNSKEQEAWLSQMAALDNMISIAEQEWPESEVDRRNQLTKQCFEQLKNAVETLAEAMPLEIQRIAICHKIQGFGQYEEFEKDQLQPGQKILVYLELDNLDSKTIASGADKKFETRTEVHMKLVDEDGTILEQTPVAEIQDTSRRIRQDYFVFLPFRIPEIPVGSYRLVAEVRDLNRNGQSRRKEVSIHLR